MVQFNCQASKKFYIKVVIINWEMKLKYYMDIGCVFSDAIRLIEEKIKRRNEG